MICSHILNFSLFLEKHLNREHITYLKIKQNNKFYEIEIHYFIQRFTLIIDHNFKVKNVKFENETLFSFFYMKNKNKIKKQLIREVYSVIIKYKELKKSYYDFLYN